MATASRSQKPDRLAAESPWPHRIALFAAVFTWPLIFVGGLVTTYRVGMAVPDWPTTFGINMFIYNFWNAAWGVFIEHGHRLYGSAVGLSTLILAAWFLVFEKRRSLKFLGVAALLAVIAQGILGGYRVRLNSTTLAAVHGCVAQAFFGLMVTLVVVTGRKWNEVGERLEDSAHLRFQALTTLILIYAQVILGAWLRHFSSAFALSAHAGFASLVFLQTLMTVWSVERQRRTLPELLASARALDLLLVGQIALGVLAWWLLRPFDGVARFVTTPQALIRTGHQANGALLLAAATVLTLRAFRLTTSPVRVSTLKTLVNDGEAFA